MMNFFNNNPEISDNIYVLPCLQESKKSYGIFRTEYEQEPSKWENNQVKPLFDKDAYKNFEKYWSGNDLNNISNDISKNGLLYIPNFSQDSHNFKDPKDICKNMNCFIKWSIYTKFLCKKFDKMNQSKNVAIIVSDLNTTDDQGLLPIISEGLLSPSRKTMKYNNNFCLKIEIDPGINNITVKFDVFFPGFPDNNSDNTNVNGILERIHTTTIRDSITNTLLNDVRTTFDERKYSCSKPMTIFVIRHGNSLHNEPLKVSGTNSLDSSLTPLGMYQAKILADQFKQANVFSNSNVILCCSFLQRTQLTGLLLLDYAGLSIGNNMKTGLDEMKRQAIMRYNNISKDPRIFETYPPANSDIPSFENYYTDLMASYQGGKRRNRKHTKKIKTRKIKTRKTKTRKTKRRK